MAVSAELNYEGGVPVLERAKRAIGNIESRGSGGYAAVGPRTKKGDRAYGYYQVMGANIPQWTKEVIGKSLTPKQFLASPAAQDAVFKAKFGSYIRQTGSVQDAASMWFTGKPLAKVRGRKDVLGTSAEQYVNKFTREFGGSGGGDQLIPAQPSVTGPEAPLPPTLETEASNPGIFGGGFSIQPSQPSSLIPNQARTIEDMTGGELQKLWAEIAAGRA